MDGTIRQGFTPSCRIPNHTCSHDVTLRIKKNKPRSPRGSTREHMCSARQSFTNTLTWRTHPVQIHLPSLAFVRRGISNIHRVRFRTGFYSRKRARGVSCVARHGPHARCCANPARSPLKLRPLPGPCPPVAVVSFAFSRSSSRVSRDSHTTT